MISYLIQPNQHVSQLDHEKKPNKATKGVLRLGMMQLNQEDSDVQKKYLEHLDQSLKLKVCI
jgi:hypothetical protein